MIAKTGQAGPKVRRDPVPRMLDGIEPWGNVMNKVPDWHYVLVSLTDQHSGVDYYHSLGYDPVEYEGPDGPRLAGARNGKKGQQIESRGHLLMKCSPEHYASLAEYGADGRSGMKSTREMEHRMRNGRNAFGNVLNTKFGRIAADPDHSFGGADATQG